MPTSHQEKWQLGLARRQRKEERKLSCDRVVQSMQQVQFVFEEESGWMTTMFADRTADDQALARNAWKEAVDEEVFEM